MTGRLFRRAAAALLLGAALLAPSPARATTFEEVNARCPNCSHAFRAKQVKSTNTFGGVDADGCLHANGASPYSCLVRVCPKCRCARLPEDYVRAPQGEKAKRFLEDVAKKKPAPGPFDLAGGLLEAEGAPPARIADCWLKAAWALRAEVRERYLHPEEGWGREALGEWREILGESAEAEDALDPTLPGARTRAGREILAALEVLGRAKAAGVPEPGLSLRRLHAAVVFRSHGELALADASMPSPAASADPANPVGRWLASVATELERGLDAEREYLKQCAAGRGGGQRGKEQPKVGCSFRIASECNRRLGIDPGAFIYFNHHLDTPGSTDADLVLVRDAAVFAGDPTPKWTAQVVSAWEDRIRLLTGLLADEGKGEDAATRLAKIADREALPGIVKALAGDGKANAATALAGYEDPGAEALAALQEIVADPEEDPEARWRAVEALAATAAESSAPALRKALAEGGLLLDPALRGIGLVGDSTDLPAILAAAEAEPKAAVRALSLLCGREFKSVEAFRAAKAEVAKVDEKAPVAGLIERLVDTSLPVRWNAFRTLRRITGKGPGLRQVLYEGRWKNPEGPDAPLDLDHVLGDGWVVMHGPLFEGDLDAMGDAVRPMRDEDGRHQWEKAKARWRKASY